MTKTYYTYLWLREDGTPYYVGKGCGKRAYIKHSHRCHPPKDSRRILVQSFPDEASAYIAEVFLIAFYGREDTGTGRLLNLTDGGEKPPRAKKGQGLGRVTWNKGKSWSRESRRKMRLAKLGKPSLTRGRKWKHKEPRSTEHRRKISAFLTGRAVSLETRVKMSERRKGKPPWNAGLSGYKQPRIKHTKLTCNSDV